LHYSNPIPTNVVGIKSERRIDYKNTYAGVIRENLTLHNPSNPFSPQKFSDIAVTTTIFISSLVYYIEPINTPAMKSHLVLKVKI